MAQGKTHSRRQFSTGLAVTLALAPPSLRQAPSAARAQTTQTTQAAQATKATEKENTWLKLTLQGLSATGTAHGVLSARLGDGSHHEVKAADGLLPEVWNRHTGVPVAPWRAQALRALQKYTDSLVCHIRQDLWDTAKISRYGVRHVRLNPIGYGTENLVGETLGGTLGGTLDGTPQSDLTQSLLAAGIFIAAPEDASNKPRHTATTAADWLHEAHARQTKTGLWNTGFRILQADETATFTREKRGFAIVRGRARFYDGLINQDGKPRSGFLNFGSQSKRDFSVRLTRTASTNLMQTGLTPDSLLNQQLEVRGWLEWRGGPYIALTHASRLRIL